MRTPHVKTQTELLDQAGFGIQQSGKEGEEEEK